jgi:hypothetical protein
MMNAILSPLLDQGVVVYLNNILIYTKTMDKHRELVTSVFLILQEKELVVAAHKSFLYLH